MEIKQTVRTAGLLFAFGSGFTNFSCVLPTSRVVYYTSKPIEMNVLLQLNTLNVPAALIQHVQI